MPRSKRSRLSEDLPPPKRVQTRASVQPSDLLPTPDDARSVATPSANVLSGPGTALLPTPDDALSVADSSSSVKVPRGPANPGVVRNRDQGALSRLPPNSDALNTFINLRNDNNISDEEALVKFITTYDVSIGTLNQIADKKLPSSFSKVKYTDIASHAWLDPTEQGRDIRELEVFRSRLPMDVFRKIYTDFTRAALQYGRMEDHDNEETRSRYISSFFTEILCLFGSAVINKAESYLDSEYTKKGRIEHLFYAMNSVSIVFIEVKKAQVLGKGRLDVIAQVLAESIACDYANSKLLHWVPILAILCDGASFEFLVYDSGNKSVYSSGLIVGVVDVRSSSDLLASSLKKGTEYIFDFFLMAYINGLRSFGHKSKQRAKREKSKKRESTEKLMDSLTRAERAHFLCREAAELAREKRYEEAEESATRGINELKESVLLAPELMFNDISGFWDEESVMTA